MLSRAYRACRPSSLRHLHSLWETQPIQVAQQPRPALPCTQQAFRSYGVFENFRKQIKGEIEKNPELKTSLEELKERAGSLATRTKATTESLYKKVEEVRAEAEATARQVSAAVKGKVSEASEQVKESVDTLRGKPGEGSPGEARKGGGSGGGGAQPAEAPGAAGAAGGATRGDQGGAQEGSAQESLGPTPQTLLKRAGEGLATAAAGLGAGLRAIWQTRAVDALKQGYAFIREELADTGSRRRRQRQAGPPPPPSSAARSDSTALVVAPGRSKGQWEKRWEEVRQKVEGHPLFRRLRRASQPVLSKSQELAEEMRDRWETSDSAVVHHIQDLNESLFGETATAAAMREIKRRDPSFSLPEFIQEVQEDVRPVLLAYLEGDLAALGRKCRREVVERCQAERRALEAQGLHSDNKILHISDVEVKDTKMLQSDPIIIVGFRTQQTTVTTDRQGKVVEGGKDNILTVYYAWAMQQTGSEEVEGGDYEPRWKLREMQRLGMQALI